MGHLVHSQNQSLTPVIQEVMVQHLQVQLENEPEKQVFGKGERERVKEGGRETEKERNRQREI